MSYELRKPITDIQKADFIVEYNHNRGLNIEDTEYFLFALEPNEIMGEKEIEIDVPDYETVTEEQEYDVFDFETIEEECQRQVFDEEGNPVLDEDGNPTYETVINKVQKPVMIDVEETIMVPDYDEETGEQTGEHEETITKQVQSSHKETKTVTYEKQVGSHKETITVPYPVIDPTYNKKHLNKLKEQKHAENSYKANLAITDGYVEFKNAQFETNAQTVGDLTATMLLMQQAGLDTYDWLSRDDKVVELTLEDFGTLGQLIAQYKGNVWNVKYLGYKEAIQSAKTVKAVENIIIDYTIE